MILIWIVSRRMEGYGGHIDKESIFQGPMVRGHIMADQEQHGFYFKLPLKQSVLLFSL